MTRPKNRVLPWGTRSQLTLQAIRAERVLLVMVDVETLSVLAVETVRPKRGGDTAEQVERVFSEHAHKLVGQGDSLPDAIAKAEAFAAGWVRPLQPNLESCGCGEMGGTA
jgi:hypothetical protein